MRTFLCLLAFLQLPAWATEREDHVPALEEAPWLFQRDDGECRLLQRVPRVGSAAFVMGRDERLYFRLQGYRRPPGETLAVVRLEPPPWQHGREAETLQQILLAGEGVLTRLEPPLAERLLQELEHGRVVSFFFPDWSDGQHAATIRLLPVGMRPALQAFLACPAQLPPPPPVELPAQPPRFTFWFATDRAELTEDGVQRMQQLCEDVSRYGPALREVRVEARADERGSEVYNLHLAEQRAQTVTEALTGCGLQPELLNVQVLGEANPDPEGSAPAAWRKNRRVVVTLLGEQGLPPELEKAPAQPPAEQAADPGRKTDSAGEEKSPAA